MTSGKKRALWFLLPFAALVGATYLSMREDTPDLTTPARPAPTAEAPRPPPPAPTPTPTSSAPVSQALTAALIRERRPATPEQAVGRLVEECFRDAAEKYPGRQEVVLSWSGRGDALAGGQVKASTIPDPRLHACFLDAMEDARWQGPAAGSERLTRTFTFGAGDGGA